MLAKSNGVWFGSLAFKLLAMLLLVTSILLSLGIGAIIWRNSANVERLATCATRQKPRVACRIR